MTRFATLSLLAALVLAGAVATAQDPAAATPAPASEAPEVDPALASEDAQFSYLVGSNVGQQLKQVGIIFNADAFKLGLEDAVGGAKPRVSEEQAQKLFQSFNAKRMEAVNKEKAEKAKADLEKGSAYLAETAKKEGVQKTESGILYEVLNPGTEGGAKPAATSTVKVHYTGTLIDGTKFDSSVDRGEPAEFPLNGVIKGWTEGLQLMPLGSKYRFHIPSDLAYGPDGRPGIPPNSVLVFEVELLEIK